MASNRTISLTRGDVLFLTSLTLMFIFGITFLWLQREATGWTKQHSLGWNETPKTMRRHSATLVWSSLSGHSEVYAKDFVYSPEDAPAIIRSTDDTRLELAPGTLVELEDPADGGFSALVLQGNVKSSSQKVLFHKAKQSHFEAIFQRVPLPLPLPTTDTLKDSLEGLQKKLEKKYATRPVSEIKKKASNFVLSDFSTNLISPADQSKVKTDIVEFSWTPNPTANDYTIELSKNANFDIKIRYITKLTQLAIKFDGKGKYYWRVKASAKDDSVVTSGVQSVQYK